MACVNPATSETYATVPLSTPADVPPARAALVTAQTAWADTPVEDRAATLSAFLDGFVERGEAVAAAISAATGKPAYGAMDELLITAAGGRHIVAGAPEWLADDTSRSCALVAGRTAVVRRVPHGVVSILTPYNFPLLLALGNVLAALLAGNAVMLKVSEAVPGIGLLIEELLAELAAGRLAPLVTVFHGAGDVGAALVDAAVGKPDHVLFIGSVGVGRKVAIAAAAGGVGCTLELGGKDAAIVCGDADISAAAEALSYGMAYNAGQCWYVDVFFLTSDVVSLRLGTPVLWTSVRSGLSGLPVLTRITCICCCLTVALALLWVHLPLLGQSIGVERAYVVESVYEDFVAAMVKHVNEKVR